MAWAACCPCGGDTGGQAARGAPGGAADLETLPQRRQGPLHGRYGRIGLDVSMYAMGVAVGDYDNDGLVDVFISGVGGNRLFKNLGGGKFRDVTAEAGLDGNGDQWSTSCGFFDYDNDGELDLFVCNYVRWSRRDRSEPGLRAHRTGPRLRSAGLVPGHARAVCYHNEGHGRFRDVSKSAGIEVFNPASGEPMAKSLGVTFIDLDNDGFLDIIGRQRHRAELPLP